MSDSPQLHVRFVDRAGEAGRPIPPLPRTMAAPPLPRSVEVAHRHRAIALVYGAACHATFGAAVLAMIVGMWSGMTQAVGTVPTPWAWLVNVALLAQFPLGHSLLLTSSGLKLLSRLAPAGSGATLSTTTYVLIASLEVLALFAL